MTETEDQNYVDVEIRGKRNRVYIQTGASFREVIAKVGIVLGDCDDSKRGFFESSTYTKVTQYRTVVDFGMFTGRPFFGWLTRETELTEAQLSNYIQGRFDWVTAKDHFLSIYSSRELISPVSDLDRVVREGETIYVRNGIRGYERTVHPAICGRGRLDRWRYWFSRLVNGVDPESGEG